MNVEDLLTRTLAAEAEERDVDLVELHRRVLDRLPETPRRRRTPWIAVAAAAVLATGTVVGLALVNSGEESARFVDEASGRVDRDFTCPVVNEIDFLTTTDDGFLPDLSEGNGPADVARFEKAATYDFDVDGSRATLRLGNPDGTLGSITTYALVDGVWQMRTAQVCAGVDDLPLAPVRDVLRLGRHGVDPWPAAAFFGNVGLPAAFVDDRPSYNLAGVLEGHRSMYVQPCERGGWCWVSGEPHAYLSSQRLAPSSETGRPLDVSNFLVNPDMMVGRENPFGLWAYDTEQPGAFSALLRDGSVVAATELALPEWGGRRVLVVLARRADVVSLAFTPSEGAVRTWAPGTLTTG